GDEIYYRRRDGDGVWRGDNLSQSSHLNSLNATIASDGVSKLFVAWDEGLSSTNHDIKFRTSFDGGVSWSHALFYTTDIGSSTYPDVVWSDATKRAYVVWQDDAHSDDAKSEIWEREFDPASLDTTAADRISHFTGRSQWPTVGTGSSRADIVWMDEVDKPRGFFQVGDWPGTLKGNITPLTGCKGTVKLNGNNLNGLKVTDSITLTGTITPETGCVPDKMQVSLNEPITDATPMLNYSAS